MKRLLSGLVMVALPVAYWAQTPPQSARVPFVPFDEFSANKPSTAPTSQADYLIGRDDFVVVEVFGEPTLTSPGRVTASGTLSLQLLGPFNVAGLTPRELEAKIETAFRDKEYLNDPHVTVTVQEYASQPVQVLGAVKTPAIYQLKGSKNLFGMIAAAGGLDQNVGATIQVMRGGLATASPTRDVITVDVADFQNTSIGLEVPVYANDAIYVSNAGSVFVAGEFIHPDEFVLRNGKNISVLQAYGKAGGFTRDAKKKEAIIIRYHKDQTRQDIPVNMEKMLKGTLPDVPMLPDDILYVPPNKTKATINRGLETTISIVTGRLIYRF